MREPLPIFVISAPSGTGKTTLARRLLAARPDVRFSVSHTTRQPRPGDVPGESYHFVDDDTFAAMRRDGAFVEHAMVHGHGYGTARSEILRIRDTGCSPLLDIDVQGGQQVRALFGTDVVSIFVLPPSLAELRRRLEGRKSDSADTVERRLRVAMDEIEAGADYDFTIVNDDLDRATAELLAIVAVAPLATVRRPALLAALRAESALADGPVATGKDSQS